MIYWLVKYLLPIKLYVGGNYIKYIKRLHPQKINPFFICLKKGFIFCGCKCYKKLEVYKVFVVLFLQYHFDFLLFIVK